MAPVFVDSDAGAIVVSVKMRDLSTLAKVDELQRSNPEIAAVIAKIAGPRKIMSDSLYEDFRPSICAPRPSDPVALARNWPAR